MTLFARGEFGFIDWLRRQAGADETLLLGIGDDCAAMRPSPGEVRLTTTDLLLEEVHFRREWTDARDLGWKSVAVNVSDIAAMGGTPDHLYLGLGLPLDLVEAEVASLVQGVLEGIAHYGLTLAGGDTCRSASGLMIAVTLQGHVAEQDLVRRSGAQPGDRLWVSGSLGDSAGALHCLKQQQEPPPFLARRHRRPDARLGLGRRLAEGGIAHAMIDVSDGFLADLGHLLQASQVGAEVMRSALPRSPELLQRFPQEESHLLALTGGEDYELLAAVPPGKEPALLEAAEAAGVPVTAVGQVTAAAGVLVVRDEQGCPVRYERSGYDHFGSIPAGGGNRFATPVKGSPSC